MSVPYWVEDAIFYQIFPDRFANGDPNNDLDGMEPWDSAPTSYGFKGGDLRGIIQKFDYLLDLGINAIYLNPIFQAPSNHRYNASDYLKIDSKLGVLHDFHALLEVAHENDVKVILDGVFNHCGRGFFAFNDLLENQDKSLYKDWFHVLKFPVDAYTPGDTQDYLSWWKFKSLPKFNTSNPPTRHYLLDVARFWIDQGADGWRLDVPNEIDDDSFWLEFRQIVKNANPEAYIVGEIWEMNPRWVGDQHFDGLMNYPAREMIISFLTGKSNASQFIERASKLLTIYPRENAFANFLPLGTHDTERIMTVLNKDLNKVKLAFLFQFVFPGAPSIYYGDEIGLDGSADPECRKSFDWNSANWNIDLRNFVQKMIHLRKTHSALRRGNFTKLLSDDNRSCAAFARTLGQEKILIAMNASATRKSIRLPVGELGLEDGLIVHNLVGEGEFIVSGADLPIVLPASTGVILK
ncbi:MAG TPA: glycoside hydrolase family 13 protein [Anaerolineaceae bacterium]|nr:glycoside hydrolase family 13 protein [Anaerolineaceae bacterium]